MLRHSAAAAIHVHIFSLCSGFSAKKNGTKKNPPRIPVTFCDFPFSSETPYALTVVTGSTSRYGLLFFSFYSAKKKIWAGNMCLSQHGAVSQYIRNSFKKKTHESFSQVDVTRSTFFAGKNINRKLLYGTFFSKNRERAQGFSESTMDWSEHDGNERARCAELAR